MAVRVARRGVVVGVVGVVRGVRVMDGRAVITGHGREGREHAAQSRLRVGRDT